LIITGWVALYFSESKQEDLSKMECTEVLTPYETEIFYSHSVDTGIDIVEIKGVDEIRNICKNKLGDEEYEIIVKGVDEVIIKGVHAPIPNNS
jgi:nitrogen regulatory protein PII-like uncharacterized protein